jgi:hypothetical protein
MLRLAKFLREGDRCSVAGNFIMLDALRGSDKSRQGQVEKAQIWSKAQSLSTKKSEFEDSLQSPNGEQVV